MLLIENDSALASLLVRAISNAGASRIDVVDDTEQAMLRATFTDYDVVIADFDLDPRTEGGLSALERVRRERLGPRTYIILSAVAREVPPWCTLVNAGDLRQLTAIVAAWG